MRRWRRPLMLLGVAGVAAALGLAAVIVQRRALTERAIGRWLAARGLAASPRVSWFGLRGLELRDLDFGTDAVPHLTIDRIAVGWSLASIVGRRAATVEVAGVRLRARWESGQPPVGVLDALLQPPGPAGEATFDLPVDAVVLRDARLYVDTPHGPVRARGDLRVGGQPGGAVAHADLYAKTPWGTVHLVGNGEIAPASGPMRWKGELRAGILEAPGLLTLEGGTVRGRGAGNALHVRFSAERVTPLGVPPPIESLRAVGTLAGSLERLELDAGATTVQDGLVVALSGEIEPRLPRVDLAVRVAEAALDHVEPGRLLPSLAGRVTELRGTVAGEGWIRYGDGKLATELKLALRDVDVVAAVGTVRRMNGVVTVVGPPLATPPAQTIAMVGIDTALPLEEGTVVFALEPRAGVRLERAEWRFQGGTLRASGLLPFGDRERTLLVAAESLDLGTLLESLAFDGLSGTGTLAGTMPFRQERDTLVIEGGRLEATQPGTIRYQRPAGTGATGNQQLDLLLAVLTDFHYEELTLTLAGDTAKPMDMTLHIRGWNPDYQGGRPVVFNVNVDAPLVGLVRAGSSAYRIPAAIEKRLEGMGIGGTR